ncbi:MAG TPA: 3-hydroxyacyl-CoA dehydrogenase NAD-binding domain-containing protein [Rariglobus sp.]|jgi:3-hydroxyacyl-CoA dehydrogenase/enoyl-CoA hydratase/3-hydroxybutyryl-CoA epimerase|nr:3-hydroxyacyl-CoA dehydrogenase NAD-binding domain-containing protein [Rariglobus sp.]
MNISRQIDSAGICTLTFDRPASSANVFDRATLAELDAHVADLEKEPQLKGVILASAKPKIFIAGADLKEFVRAPDADALGEIVDLGHLIFTRLAALPVPSVAAIHGVCLGGGCELALACDWRVASTGKVTKIGLPETQLGILPAWGGCVRLPALIGLPAALGIILPGRQVVGAQALKLGLVDELAHPEYLHDAARRQLTRGKRVVHPRLFSGSRPFKALVSAQARRGVLAKTHGHYPAPLKAIEVCAAALGRPLEEGFVLEKVAFLSLLETVECRNLIGIFFLQERAKKLSVPAPAVAAQVRRVAVVGAGVMGAGIAQWVSARGIPVVLKDVAPDALARGLHTAGSIYREAVKRRVFTMTEATAGLDRITPVCADVPLANVDLVIEAAVEKLEAKQAIFRDLETRARADTVLATNTSALSIDAIAGGLANPERVVGIHFFNPVHRMQLVEIVRGSRTSPDALATAVQFVKALGKLPVIVKDSPGFLVNRILLPYMTEAVRMFRAGGGVAEIDRVMLDFGMPMGPLRLADEVGLDVAQHVAADLAHRLAHPMPVDDTLTAMIAQGWFGKKSGCGFYLHSGKAPGARPNPKAAIARGAVVMRPLEAARMRDRLVLIMVNEAARCLAEGVIEAPEDMDFAMILGTGWAPFRGGPLRYADSLGPAEVVRRLEVLSREVAPHFEPCERLREMVAAGARFYPPETYSRP